MTKRERKDPDNRNSYDIIYHLVTDEWAGFQVLLMLHKRDVTPEEGIAVFEEKKHPAGRFEEKIESLQEVGLVQSTQDGTYQLSDKGREIIERLFRHFSEEPTPDQS